jgi:cellulose synthase (UDP-forming)
MSNTSVSRPPAAAYLPTPPDERQRLAYLAPQRRGIVLVGYALTMLAVYSQVRFAVTTDWTMALLAASAATVAVATVSLYTSSRRRRIEAYDHNVAVASWHWRRPATDYPAVDVFLPSCGEDLRVLENTYRGVAALTWPNRMDVLVLDDSARPAVAALAARYGFRYLTRPDRGRLKKAGNLLYGYQHSQGALILVLDADFVPRGDMLRELVPYFDDATVGIVQSPQFFESVPGMNWLQRGAGITQEFFYRWVQPSRDAIGAPICVGSCAVYRRSALEAAGGFAQIGHSEDVHTGVKLLRAGLRTRYVPVNLAKGVCPDSLDAFINQQYRWCTGSMSLLADRSFHALDLGWRRKLAFFSGFGYYLLTGLLVFILPIPTLIMMWGFTDHFHPRNYLPILPIILWAWVGAPAMLAGRWGPEVFRVQVIYGYAHAMAIWDLLRGRTSAWVPTGAAPAGAAKPRASVGFRVRRLMLVWITGTQFLLWLGLIHAAAHNNAPITSLPVALLLALSAIIQLPIVTAIIAGMPPVSMRRMTRGFAAALASVTVAGVAFTAAAGAEQLVPAAKLVAALRPSPITTVDRVAPEPAERPVAASAKAPGTAPGRTTPCVPLTSQAERTFLDAQYEGARYVIGFTKSVTFCASPHEGIRLLQARTLPQVVDSAAITLTVDGQESRVRECGRGCVEHTTVVQGTATRSNGRALATAVATIRTRITQAGTTTHSSIAYHAA